jgi:peptidyl-prolyl cis-trans isomerase C
VGRAALLVFVCACAAFVSGCGRGDTSGALARVDDATLSANEFYASIPGQLLAVMSLDDQEEALKSWVKTELFYKEGLRRGFGDDPEILRRVHEIERELVAEKCIQDFMEGVPEVTEEEARQYFQEHKSDYSIQVRLAHILVRSRPEAERALEEIRSGTPFENVAESMSIDQTAAQGGDLGYMWRGEMLHELEEPAFELKVGEVSDVIESNYGYHLIKVLDRHPGAGQPSFESKRAAVMNFLTSKRRRAAFDKWMTDLTEHATVLIDTVLLREEARARIRTDTEFGEPAAVETTAAGAR